MIKILLGLSFLVHSVRLKSIFDYDDYFLSSSDDGNYCCYNYYSDYGNSDERKCVECDSFTPLNLVQKKTTKKGSNTSSGTLQNKQKTKLEKSRGNVIRTNTEPDKKKKYRTIDLCMAYYPQALVLTYECFECECLPSPTGHAKCKLLEKCRWWMSPRGKLGMFKSMRFPDQRRHQERQLQYIYMQKKLR